jgi:hypothetical protein
MHPVNHEPSSTAELQKRDRATILHPFTEGPSIFAVF